MKILFHLFFVAYRSIRIFCRFTFVLCTLYFVLYLSFLFATFLTRLSSAYSYLYHTRAKRGGGVGSTFPPPPRWSDFSRTDFTPDKIESAIPKKGCKILSRTLTTPSPVAGCSVSCPFGACTTLIYICYCTQSMVEMCMQSHPVHW